MSLSKLLDLKGLDFQPKNSIDVLCCSICCENYTILKRQKITCPYCKYHMCKICGKKYIMEIPLSQKFNCPDCHHEFLFEDLVKMFPRTFVNNELAKKKMQMLFEYDKSFLPQAQRLIEISNEIYQNNLNNIIKIKQILPKITNILNSINASLPFRTIYDQCMYYIHLINSIQLPSPNFSWYENITYRFNMICDLVDNFINDNKYFEQLLTYTNQLQNIFNTINTFTLEYTITHVMLQNEKNQILQRNERMTINEVGNIITETTTTTSTTTLTQSYIKACPKNNCNGFLKTNETETEGPLSCSLCHINICSKCDVIKTDNTHICSPDDIQTVERIQKETKKCPKCLTNIFKISGCYQMWCTVCHTAFDWTNGKQMSVTNAFHNPHLSEWKRNINSHQINNECVTMSYINNILRHFMHIKELCLKRYLDHYPILTFKRRNYHHYDYLMRYIPKDKRDDYHTYEQNKFKNFHDVFLKFIYDNSHLYDFILKVKECIAQFSRLIPVTIHRNDNHGLFSEDDLWNLRKQYLKNEITSDNYGKALYKFYFGNKKREDYVNLHTCFENAFCDLFGNLHTTLDINAFKKDTESLRVYINSQMNIIDAIYRRGYHGTHGSKFDVISSDFTIVTVQEKKVDKMFETSSEKIHEDTKGLDLRDLGPKGLDLRDPNQPSSSAPL